MTKLVLGTAVGLIAALFIGWVVGRSGQSALARAAEAAELRGDLLGARAALLDARVAIYNVNFGEASRHLENARGLLGRAEAELTRQGGDADIEQVHRALASIDDAQRMAGKLDPSANTHAGEAAKILADLLAAHVSAALPALLRFPLQTRMLRQDFLT